MSEPVRVAREGAVTRLTLNRPDRANALSAEMVEALLAALAAARGDGTRLLLLAGEGRHFCAGFDFTGIETASDGDLALRFLRVETLLQELYHAPFPTLALAHGRVFGAGADLVCCCSRRVAAPGTSFLMPGPRFGVVLGTRRLAARIGADRAQAIQTASRAFDAGEAQALGFLTGVSPAGDWPALVEEARAAAEMLDAETVAALRAVTIADSRAADMAALAVSVSRPGLKNRILAYRAAQTRR